MVLEWQTRPMRLLAALVLPALLTLAIAVAAVRIVGGLPASPQTHAW